ncbi:hypothetical protein QMK19_31330 [Streptomyces sp. H10-C2]|uniref:hypothetical protein n=1 Tax=unclassified Streptomyces TaxID=2593676 RepID=UPI0024BA1BFC|nr:MULTISPECIES: hypothetical protein [unclassified Streptomyces]MDJ0345111.1 hypothetical protein [Streptomyces sp. PH10-H1]MDJ0374016.1 hypothetical protein [Streptomyces sp. H10-C2]
MVMQRRRMVTAAAAAGFVCGVTVLAGCAGNGAAADGLGADSGDSVRRAADVLVRAGSSKVTTSMEMASGGTRVMITGSGGFDYGKGRGELRITLPRDAAGAQEHHPVTELMTPGSLYMKDRGEGVPADKWVRVDTTQLSDGNLVTGGATDPLAAAELLRGARKVELVGEETFLGVRVRHFRGSTDIARAARSASPATRGPLAAAAKGFTVTEVPFDVYLDAQGRPRKVSQRFTFSSDPSAKQVRQSGKPGTPRDVTVTSTTVLDTFGTPVNVVLPKSADIYNGKIVTAPPK